MALPLADGARVGARDQLAARRSTWRESLDLARVKGHEELIELLGARRGEAKA